MFGHLSAVQSRRLGENVLCHVCCAHVQFSVGTSHRESGGVPLPFWFPLLLAGISPEANGMVSLLQNYKGIQDQLCERPSKVSEGDFWKRMVRSCMKWSQRHFLLCGLFLL